MKLASCLAVAVCAAAVLLPPEASAQTIYRCGNEYTRVPCHDGIPLESADTRSAAQRAEARAVVAEQRRQAQKMQVDRQRAENATKPALAGSVGPVRSTGAPATAASAPKKPVTKNRKEQAGAQPNDDFVAATPGKGKNQQRP